MQKILLSIAALSGAFAVILGAFGAHALKEKLSPEQLQTFETGVRYQMYHTFALIAVALLLEKYNNSLLNYSGYLFITGIILFSGSLYLLATKILLGIENWIWLGAVTPIGGLCFIFGWILLLINFLKN